MKSTEAAKIPKHLIVTASITASLTIVVSLAYIVLSSVTLAFRFNCDAGNLGSVLGAGYFMNVIHRVYFLGDECAHGLRMEGVTHEDTVLYLVVFTLVFSTLTLISAIGLFAVINNDNVTKYINMVVYTYLALCIASLVVDLVLAVFFGMDYGLLGAELDRSSGGLAMNYFADTVRLGSMFLMVISLKGFLYPAVNIALLVVLVIFTVEYQNMLQKNEHPIHTLGALNAYEQQKRQEDPWQRPPEVFLGVSRSHHSNPAFMNDDMSTLSPRPRSPIRETSMSEYSSNRFFDRSESWQARSAQTGSRPFSYLADSNRPMAAKPPMVPAPDYSPPTARRLKSALKPAYM